MSRIAPPVMAAVASGLILTGCAGNQPRPDDQLNAAEAAVTQAESAGAREAAPKLLKQARDKVGEARGLMGQEEYARAQRLLEQATADARVAGERARTADIRQAVRELNKTIDMLETRIMEEPT